MKFPYEPDVGRTHWEGCYTERGHHNCAVIEVNLMRGVQQSTRMSLDTCRTERDIAIQERDAAYVLGRREMLDDVCKYLESEGHATLPLQIREAMGGKHE